MPALEVKICGLTRHSDAIKALELGADYLGFILYKKSPRYICPDDLAELCSALPYGTKTVGVCVNMLPQDVMPVVQKCGLSVVQLHGDEQVGDYTDLPVRIWKAVRVAPGKTALPEDAHLAERLVVDTAVQGMYGGTGKHVDLDTAACIAEKYKVMLGGGMTPENAAASIKAVQPVGIDVSSGVEESPGIKSHEKLEAFFKATRPA